MSGITRNIYVFMCATLMAVQCILGQLHQHHHHTKPWPTYSLQNMPQTRFTCHDKILGGYYADPETQCQMFHVCVKVAGGVQDFRFLCPNSTAFDQEAQICADWGDVDCEESVLYYGSDNFDLYRISSGFESKRAPLAEEEEATFHLQRAESADIRRSKETRVDQKLRPDQPPAYTKQRNNFNNYNNNNNNNNNRNINNNYNNYYDGDKRLSDGTTKEPIANFYTPTTSTTTITTTKRPRPTTTTTTTTERYNDESKQDLDEIFKGSHSSHYFANRNGGREDEFQDLPAKVKQNDFDDYSRKSTDISAGAKTRVQSARGHSRRIQPQQPQQQHSATETTTRHTTPPSTTRTTTTTTITKLNKKFTLQPFYETDFNAFSQPQKGSATTTTTTTKTSGTQTTARPSHSNANRFSFSALDYQTQEKIQPTTYNPVGGAYRFKATTAAYPAELGGGDNKLSDGQQHLNNNNVANQSRRKPQKPPLSHPQNSTFVNREEFAEFAKIKTQDPQPFKPAQVFRPPVAAGRQPGDVSRAEFNQADSRVRARGQPAKNPSVTYQEPKPFSAPQRQRAGNLHNQQPPKTSSTTAGPATTNAQPRGFASRGSINYKATTQRTNYYNDNNNNFYNNNNNNNKPTSSSHAPKKFSTLVPKEQQYQPTTFKPTTYKKAYENAYFASQQTARPAGKGQTTKSAAAAPVGATVDPHSSPDEDDGQYHPELYEVDFAKNRLKLQRSTTTTTTTTVAPTTSKVSSSNNNNNHYPQSHLKTQQQSFFQKQQQQQQQQRQEADSADLSDEDELFKTAHSLNFGAASINKLRADIFKAEKDSQQYNSQYGLNQAAASPAKTAAPSYQPTTSSAAFSYPTYAPTTSTFGSTAKPFSSLTATATTPSSPPVASHTSTTGGRLLFTTTTTTARPAYNPEPPSAPRGGKSHKGASKKGSKSKKTQKSVSKRPPHADEDTSYDYAYYDSDSLSESPQAYPEYEIAEFTKTRAN